LNDLSKFLLPFIEGQSGPNQFSPTAIFLSAVVFAIIISIQTNLLYVLILVVIVVLSGTIAKTKWRLVISLAARFELVILFWVFLVPFLYGSTIIASIPLPWMTLYIYQEGFEFGILLGLRMFGLITLFVATLSHMTLVEFIGALRTVKVPVIILGSLLIMLRYIPQFLEERSRMQEAQTLRGFERGSRWGRIKSLGFMVGSSIDRGLDRSVTVYEAMKLRGFGRGMIVKGSSFRRKDALLGILLVLLLFSVVFVIPPVLEVISL
jgi:energy-coupling factor transporter transmembrane protein EcfT